MEATIVEVHRLLNEYKQYFLLPLQPKATSLKKEKKGELSQVVGDPS